MSMPWDWRLTTAQREVSATVESLPLELREPARALPVVYETVPSDELVADDIPPDTLGLFVGPPHAHRESGGYPLPPQIILFLDNLWGCADGDETWYCDEVRTTYLHELGHYLGLDEDDLDERGLG